LEFKDSLKLGALKSVHESWLNDRGEVTKNVAILFIFGAPIALLLTPFISVWASLTITIALLVLVCVTPFIKFRVEQLPALALYEKGFAAYGHTGLQEITWEEIESVSSHASILGGRSSLATQNVSCTVRVQNGQVIEIDSSFAQAQSLATRILQHSAGVLLPKYLAKFHASERITFGSLVLDRNALSFSSQLPIAWQKIRNAKSDGLQVMIYFKDNSRPLAISISAVPNYYLVCALINSLANTRGESQ
jgi:hypothetical protein